MQRRPVTIQEILGWADLHHHATGKWPATTSGCVLGALGENWRNLDDALRKGVRTLAGDSSLAQLLAAHRGVALKSDLPPLSLPQILQWADEHQQRTGSWPTVKSGVIAHSGGVTWQAVQHALGHGKRGLTGSTTMAQLLAEHRGARHQGQLADLTEEQILQWMDAHHERTGHWPSENSG